MHNKKDNKHNKFRKGKPNQTKPFEKKNISFNKSTSKSVLTRLHDDHKDDLGNEYSLNDIVEIGYPMHEVNIDIIASGKPDSILQEIHLLLCELINAGLNTKATLSNFLGVTENDFILDELFTLLGGGIIAIAEDDNYRVTSKGDIFIKEKKFVPVTTQENFKFFIDGLNKEITAIAPSKSANTTNRLTSEIKIDFDFIQEHWWQITRSYSSANSGDKEIVDLASYKRSITSRTIQFQKLFVLLYYPKEKSGKKIQLKVYNSELFHLKKQTEILAAQFASNKYLLDFSKELEDVEQYKKLFLDSAVEIGDEKMSGKYQDISTFEHKELIKEALLTAEIAVYIESPWIRRATMDYIHAMDLFLSKKNTKLFISYGIDSSFKNLPHKETFEEIEKLAQKYKGRMFLFHLPTHFKQKFPNRNGSHRKLLIKDHDYYVKGSFNWLSYSGNETENYAVEEGTQFFDNVKAFWSKVFSDYQLDMTLLSF